MYSALYYPHTGLQKPEFAKTALLLWDKVDYISPFRGYNPRYEDPDLAEAAEILTVEHIPTEDEKQEAHSEIERLVNGELPDWFLFDPDKPNLSYYEVMPEKLWPGTWEMLLHSEFVRQGTSLAPSAEYGHHEVAAKDYVTNTSLGLTIMSILADICAGEEKETITDESDNYAALTRYFTERSNGRYGNVSLASDTAPEAERLVTVSLNTLSGRASTLKDLVKLRKRQENERSPFLWELRRKYFDEVNMYIDRLRSVEKVGDKAEIEREFEVAMEADLKNLQRELRLESWRLLFSKEMLVAVTAAADALVESVTTPTIDNAKLGTAASLVRALFDYRKNRRSTYKSHAMSWLYQTHPSRIYG